MTKEKSKNINFDKQDVIIKRLIDSLIRYDVDFAYHTLSLLQTVWPDFLAVDELFQLNPLQKMALNFKEINWSLV